MKIVTLDNSERQSLVVVTGDEDAATAFADRLERETSLS